MSDAEPPFGVTAVLDALPLFCEVDLRLIIDEANDALDLKLGRCPDCHGSGREHGDPDFECGSCDGEGTRAAYERPYSEDEDGDGA